MRSFVRAILSVMLCAGVLVAIPVPASAAVGDLLCTATAQGNFVPPLTSSGGTVDVDVTGALSNCVSPNQNYTALQSASITGSGTATAVPGVPCSLLLTINFTATVVWSPPGSPNSELDVVVSTNPPEISAVFTDGLLDGDSMLPLVVVINPNPDCLLGQLKYLTTSLSVTPIG
jgi:hypothetical protein